MYLSARKPCKGSVKDDRTIEDVKDVATDLNTSISINHDPEESTYPDKHIRYLTSQRRSVVNPSCIISTSSSDIPWMAI